MKKVILLIPLIFFACNSEKENVKCEVDNMAIFSDSIVNKFLIDYLNSHNSSSGNTIYTIVFDTDTTVIISQALYIKKKGLIGHKYIGKDILVIYSDFMYSDKHLNMKSMQNKSIKGFPLSPDNIYPFDPVEKKIDLKNKSELKGFEGSNRPILR